MAAWWFNIDLDESVVTLCLTLSLSGVHRLFINVYHVYDNAWLALFKAAPGIEEFAVISWSDFIAVSDLLHRWPHVPLRPSTPSAAHAYRVLQN